MTRRLIIAIGATLAFAAHAAPTAITQTTYGWCSPTVANVAGNVTIVCQGVDPKALARLNAALDRKDQELVERVREADEWAAKYHDLNARLAVADPNTAEQRAAALLKEGRLEEAGEVLDQLLDKEDEVLRRLARIQYSRAEVYSLQFYPLKALPHYRKAHTYDPDNIDYTLTLAKALQAQREYSDALGLYRQVLAATEKKAADGDSAALLARAKAFQGIGSLVQFARGRGQPEVEVAQPKRVRIAHVLVHVPRAGDSEAEKAAKAKIEEVIRRARAGEDFAKLAREFSDDTASAKKGGDLGFFRPGEMIAPIEQAAFALKKGEVSGPIRTTFGYHAIKVLDVQPGGEKVLKQPSFTQRITQLVAYYEKAVAAYRQLDKQTDGTYTFDLARAIEQLAQAVHVRDLPDITEMTKLSNEAADLFERLAAAHPDKKAYYLAYAMGAVTGLATAQQLAQTGKNEPPPALKRVLSLHERIRAASPDYFTVEVAGSYVAVSLTYFLQHDFKKSEEASGIAIGILERRSRPGDEFYDALPALYMVRSMALTSLRRSKQALAAAERSVQIARELAARSPKQYEPQLAGYLDRLSTIQEQLGKRDDAKRTAEESTRIKMRYNIQ